MARKSKKQPRQIVHPRCAGIDIGSREHWVAVDPDRDDKPVRCFSTLSDDLYALADWLKSLDVEVMAMAATGVHWIPLYEVLDARGFPVNLVNSRATRQGLRTQVRRLGQPVAGSRELSVPPRDRLATFDGAPTHRSGPRAIALCAAQAEGADIDEQPARQCGERSDR